MPVKVIKREGFELIIGEEAAKKLSSEELDKHFEELKTVYLKSRYAKEEAK